MANAFPPKTTTARTRLLLGLVIGLLLAPAAARAQGDEVVYYHTDAIGSVRMITDATGAVVARYDYLPFGEEWPTTPAPPTDVRQFAGKERDAETGLDYFGARYYRAQSGRFSTVDPVYTWQENLADPQRWNRYAYVRNNPLRYADPDGRILFDFQEFKANLTEALHMGQPGYGFLVPTVAGIAAIGSAASDALMVAGGAANVIRAVAREGGRRAAKATGVGEYARESIPARSSARDFTAAERSQINEIGRRDGCHSCGAKDPGTKAGNFVPDHQPPSALNPNEAPQNLYPHCINCSRDQGLAIANQKKLEKLR